LRDQGVLFAGIDVIGDYMTEVNVTSPTGIRELDRAHDLNIAGLMFDAIEKHL
jgi:glutathione synthase